MKKVRNILLTTYLLGLFLAAAIYVIMEFMDLGFDVSAGKLPDRENFVFSTVMILITLAIIPTALRLFKFRCVARNFEDDAIAALQKWGSIRIVMLAGVLLINLIMYYFFGHEPVYGYLAIMVLISMVFIFPSMRRCYAETSEYNDFEDDHSDHRP